MKIPRQSISLRFIDTGFIDIDRPDRLEYAGTHAVEQAILAQLVRARDL